MTEKEKSEVRIELPLDEIAVLDAYCTATGKNRTAIITSLVSEWAKAKKYEAMIICRVAGCNPAQPDGQRKP